MSDRVHETPKFWFYKGKLPAIQKIIEESYCIGEYYFSSEKNKAEFSQNPSKYKPQYGGWCAYAMGSNGEKVEVNPETFKLIDGKLYLFTMLFLITR